MGSRPFIPTARWPSKAPLLGTPYPSWQGGAGQAHRPPNRGLLSARTHGAAPRDRSNPGRGTSILRISRQLPSLSRGQPQNVLSQARFLSSDLHAFIESIFQEDASATSDVRRDISATPGKRSAASVVPRLSPGSPRQGQMRRFAKIRVAFWSKSRDSENKNLAAGIEDIPRIPGNPMLRGTGEPRSLDEVPQLPLINDQTKGQSPMSMTQVRHLMQELRLRGMATALDKTIEDSKKDDWTTEELIDALFKRRPSSGTEERFRAASRQASSSTRHRLRTRTSPKRSLTKPQLKEIYSLTWLNDGRPLVLVGQTGVGKSSWPRRPVFMPVKTGKRAVHIDQPLAGASRICPSNGNLSQVPRAYDPAGSARTG